MASRCSFQVPDSDFHAPACVHRSHQDSKSVPSLRPQVTPRAAHFAKGRDFPNFQTPETCVGTGSLPGRISTKQNINQTVDDYFGLSRSGDLLSNFQLPASGVGSQTGEEFPASSFRRAFAPGHSGVGGNFQFPASGFQLWPGGCKAERISRFQSPSGSSRHKKARSGGISGFRLPAPLWREELGKSECTSLRRVKFRRETRVGEFPE
jgi:hypothetical protein